jgi:hypothetical protein
VPVPSDSTRTSSPWPEEVGLEYRRNRWVIDRGAAIDAAINVARYALDHRWCEIGLGGARRARHVLEREIVGWVLPGPPGFEKDRRRQEANSVH